MNVHINNHPVSAPRPHRWFIAGLVLLLMMSALVMGALSCLHVGRDTAALRNCLTSPDQRTWEKRIEVRAGTWFFHLARAVVSLVDIEPEARQALKAARSAEVAVYHRNHCAPAIDHAALVAATDATMNARGWQRLVEVAQGKDLVLAYVPEKIRSPRDLQVCVAVLSGQELVVVSARSNLEPLLDLAMKNINNVPNW